jgi:hypothetical protein
MSAAAQTAQRSPSVSRVVRLHELNGDTPKENLRKLEWAIWSALGELVVEDSGPRYELSELIAAHLFIEGAIIND